MSPDTLMVPGVNAADTTSNIIISSSLLSSKKGDKTVTLFLMRGAGRRFSDLYSTHLLSL
jgi:hypothetical protein